MTHSWCRDIPRDEAIRAAEDAAANWRLLEVGERIEEGDQCRSKAEGSWFETGEAGSKFTSAAASQLIYRRRRVLPPDHRDLPAAVAELRERVARLESVRVAEEPSPFFAACPIAGGTVKVNGKDMVTLTEFLRHTTKLTQEAGVAKRERDAAIRERDAARADAEHDVREVLALARKERDAAKEECERRLTMCEFMKRQRDAAQFHVSCLKARVAEMEAAPAASGAAGTEPVAWGIVWKGKHDIDTELVYLDEESAQETAKENHNNGTVTPLYAAPQPPRGWLRAEERGAVDAARDYFDNDDHGDSECVFIARVLKQILARSTPPRVQLPPEIAGMVYDAASVRNAIRAAGGEVE